MKVTGSYFGKYKHKGSQFLKTVPPTVNAYLGLSTYPGQNWQGLIGNAGYNVPGPSGKTHYQSFGSNVSSFLIGAGPTNYAGGYGTTNIYIPGTSTGSPYILYGGNYNIYFTIVTTAAYFRIALLGNQGTSRTLTMTLQDGAGTQLVAPVAVNQSAGNNLSFLTWSVLPGAKRMFISSTGDNPFWTGCFFDL